LKLETGNLRAEEPKGAFFQFPRLSGSSISFEFPVSQRAI